MTRRARRAAAAITLAGALWPTTIALPPAPAHSAAAVISPGDRIDIDSDTCTLGYPFTTGVRSYAITAGHCQAFTGQQVRDEASGATGTLLRAVIDPPHSGGADYGLIDFGAHTRILPIVARMPLGPTPSGPPRPGQTICHTGATTATHCGTVLRPYGPDQYLTADDMAVSRGGDSGGPVFTADDSGRARIIGIWLGGYQTASGDDYGRFGGLTPGLAALRISD